MIVFFRFSIFLFKNAIWNCDNNNNVVYNTNNIMRYVYQKCIICPIHISYTHKNNLAKSKICFQMMMINFLSSLFVFNNLHVVGFDFLIIIKNFMCCISVSVIISPCFAPFINFKRHLPFASFFLFLGVDTSKLEKEIIEFLKKQKVCKITFHNEFQISN